MTELMTSENVEELKDLLKNEKYYGILKFQYKNNVLNVYTHGVSIDNLMFQVYKDFTGKYVINNYKDDETLKYHFIKNIQEIFENIDFDIISSNINKMSMYHIYSFLIK